jgi:hypothetical protein
VTADQELGRQNAAPSRPYSLILAEGRQLYIDHPDFVSASKNEELVTGFDMSGGVEIVDLTLVVSLRYGPKLAPKSQ